MNVLETEAEDVSCSDEGGCEDHDGVIRRGGYVANVTGPAGEAASTVEQEGSTICNSFSRANSFDPVAVPGVNPVSPALVRLAGSTPP